MGTLSGGDRALIDAMRHGGEQDRVLRDIDWTRFNFTRLIMVACSDGYVLPGIMEHQHRLAEIQKPGISLKDCCFQTPALNGGALLIAEKSPIVSDLREDLVLHSHICNGIRLKKLDADGERPRILLRTHTSCGAAESFGLDVIEQMEWVSTGKKELKKKHSQWQILCCLDVDYPAERRESARQRSYSFSTNNLEEWLNSSYGGGIVHRIRNSYGLRAAAA